MLDRLFNPIFLEGVDLTKGFEEFINSLITPKAVIIYIIITFVLLFILLWYVISNEIMRRKYEKERLKNHDLQVTEDVVNSINDSITQTEESLREEIRDNTDLLDHLTINGVTTTGYISGSINSEISAPSPRQQKNNGSRFYMLSEIDKAYETYVSPIYEDTISLKEICDRFREFSARELKLYYDIHDIRRFIAGHAVTKLLILQGMSGTGKTSLAYAWGQFLGNKTIIVPIQPMWKERTDLIGYYNEFTKKFNETTLLYKMYEANNNREIYCVVLDEMNIARIEYYFAEFLSLLEIPDLNGRNLDVVADVWPTDPKLLNKGKLRLPFNMWFVGTANNDDSTFAISDKVYDRAMVINLDKKADVFEGEKVEPLKLSIDHFDQLMKDAQKEFKLSERNLHRIEKLDEHLIETFHITFGNRIMKQINVYVPVMVACGGTELDALDDILSRKVLRKLESKNPVYVKSQAESLCQFLDDLFGQDKMALCKETIHHIEQNA